MLTTRRGQLQLAPARTNLLASLFQAVVHDEIAVVLAVVHARTDTAFVCAVGIGRVQFPNGWEQPANCRSGDTDWAGNVVIG
jgi:hypothetical protein